MSDKPVSGTGNSKTFSCLRVFLAVVAIVGAMVIGIGILLVSDMHPSLSRAEKMSSLEFPPSSRLLKSHGRWFLETHILAKIEMDRADVQAFVDSLPEPREMSETDKLKIRHNTYAMDWWDTDSVRRFKAIEFSREESYDDQAWWRILIDLDDPDRAIVYLDYCEP